MKPITMSVPRFSLILTMFVFAAVLGTSYVILVVHAVAPTTGNQLGNNIAIAWKDSAGTVRNCLYDDASNNLQIGATNCNPTLAGSLGVGADATYDLGTAALRFRSFYASTQYRIYAAASDANPTSSLESGALKFGLGGSNSLDSIITRLDAFDIAYQTTSAVRATFNVYPNGLPVSGIGGFTIYRTNDLTTNINQLLFGYDYTNNFWTLKIQVAGTETQKPFLFQVGPTEIFRVSTTPDLQFATKFSKYNGIATAGWGLSAIYASYSTTGNTGAVTNAINYTPPATAGTYCISAYVDVTAWTTPASFQVQITYTDATGNARTDKLGLSNSAGTAVNAATAVDRYYGSCIPFQINNGAVAITLSTVGTFTGSPTYNLAAILEQKG